MRNGVVDEAFQRRDATLIGERAHHDTIFQAIAHLDCLGCFHKTFKEPIGHTFLHKEAGRGDTDLAGIAELGKRGDFDGLVDIGVVEDHDRRMAAQFHRCALHVPAGQCSQMFANGRGACEGYLANDRMRNEIFRNL